jgi:cysteine desulfurase
LRLPNNINISFKNIDGEMLVLALDGHGVCVSTGSACSSSSTDPSHVIEALGLPEDYARGNIRISLGRLTTKKDLDYTIKVLIKEIARLRK